MARLVTSRAPLVAIYGGSGFLGRQVARLMAQQGWRVRVACRRPNQAGVVRTYGAVGQVEPVPCNVRDDLSVLAIMSDVDAVINCVGIMVRQGRNSFAAIHEEAAGRIARLSAETGVARMVHVSALGADPDADSEYARSKGRGEEAVLAARPDAVILRPSIIFGTDDSFFNKIAAMTRMPIMFVPGLGTEVQPVWVEDVARAVALAADGRVAPGIHELGGPDVMTMRDVTRLVLRTVNRRRPVWPLPGFMAGTLGAALDAVQTVSGGLLTNRVLTRDQARTLRRPNRVRADATGFAEMGIVPVSAAAVIPDYLWRFRKGGEYAEIKASARNLRQS